MNACKQCSSGFETTDADRLVLKKFDVPGSTLCPDCRMQRRTAFRTEMSFHRAVCDVTKAPILTNIAPGRGYRVAGHEAWYSDQWDPLAYGRDFDFSRPFFEQMDELIRAVPHISVMQNKCDNCDYCNYASESKDSYYSTRVANTEQGYYSYLPVKCFRVFDGYYMRECQDCYQAVDCSQCSGVTFSQNLKTCRNVHFSLDCVGCEHCFGCVGLRHKQYYFFNQPLSKEQYEAALGKLDLGSYAFLRKIQERFYQEEALKRPRRHAIIENSENVLGNYIYESRNVFQGFDVNNAEDIRYSWGVVTGKDQTDVYATHLAEEIYNSVSVLDSRQIRHSYAIFTGCYDLEYCFECANNVKNCFACVGLKHKQFCLFNKQYSEAEYHPLKAKIIEHLRNTGEYGEFFPMSLSPFAYNESVAQEYFPLTHEAVEAQGLLWFEEKRDPSLQPYAIPDRIDEVKDDILETALICETTGRPYKILVQELTFYRENKIPIPRLCPYERHMDRIHLRAPRKLWERSCQKCNTPVQTVYAPNRPEIVYCEACYLKEVY